MLRMRWARVLVVASVVAACLAATIDAVGAAAAARSPNLQVTVTGLPTGTAAAVQVVGPLPGHHVRRIGHSALLRVPHGRYRVKAGRVKVGANWQTATPQTQTITVRKTGRTRVAVAYTTAIPTSTKTLGQPALSDLTSVSPDQTQLVFAPAAAPSGLAVGDVIGAGVSDQTPDGLLRRVTALSTASDGSLVVTTSPATLDEAVASGDIDVSSDSGAPAAAQGRRPNAASTLSQNINRSLSCGSASSIGVTGSLSLNPTWKFTAHIGSHPTANFNATFTETAQLAATAQAGASCALSPVPLLAKPISLRPITFFIGWLPVVIVPQVQFYLSGHGQVTAQLTAAVGQQLTAKAGIAYANGSYTPSSSITNTFTYTPPTPSLTGDVKVAAGPQLQLLFYGVAGPEATVNATVELSVDTTASPWWKLLGGVEGGGGLVVPDLNLNYSNDSFLSASTTIAHASGPGSGSNLVVAVLDAGEGLATMNPDGSGLTPVPNTAGAGCPIWNSAHTEFAYVQGSSIWVSDPSGATARQIYTAPEIAQQQGCVIGWSGSTIAFTTESQTPGQIWPDGTWVVNDDGSNAHQLTALGGNTSLAFSPDQSQFLTSSNYGNDDACLFAGPGLVDADGSNSRAIIPYYGLGNGGRGNVLGGDFSPNGATAVLEEDGDSTGGCQSGWNADVVETDMSGSNAVSLYEAPLDTPILRPVYSPDGSQIMFGQGCQLIVMNADGSNPHAVANLCQLGVGWVDW
jgi:hypothetical protein